MIEETSSTLSATLWAVDDEPDVLLSLGGLLEDAGFGFRGFDDAIGFVDELASTGNAPDLLIVDLNMPGLSGIEVIRKVRAMPVGDELPIIVLTALASEGSLLNAFEAGADDVVRKPYSLSEFLARITWQLSQSRRFRKLRRRNDDLLLLTEMAQTMSRETSLGPVLETLAEGVAKAIDDGEASIFLTGGRNELVRSGGGDVLDLRDAPRTRDAIARRERLFLEGDDASVFANTLGHDRPETVRSAVLLPLMVRDLFVGAMAITSLSRTLGKDRESSIVSIVGDFAAVAIHRAQLFQSVLQESARIDAANREIARTRDFLSNVIDSSPNAVVVSDRAGKIVVFNAAAERILGRKRADAIGSDVRTLYPDKGAERVKRMLLSENWGGRGRLASQRIDVIDAGGQRVPVHISAALIDDDPEGGTATVGIFTDLRSQLAMEEQLQEATESLERTRRQVVIAELAGAAAHELNQPLTSLLGYAELLDSKMEPDDPYRRPVETILVESQRIADIVRKIGRITQYKTKEYVGGARIVDLDSSSEVEEISEGSIGGGDTAVMDVEEERDDGFGFTESPAAEALPTPPDEEER